MIDDGYIKDGLVFAMVGGLLVDVAKNNAITNNGATLTTDHNGRANRGFAFNGSAQLAMTAFNQLGYANNFTIVINFNLTDVTVSQWLYNNYISATDIFTLRHTSSTLRIGITNNVTPIYLSTAALTSNTSYLLILSKLGSVLTGRLNNVPLTGTSGAGFGTTAGSFIGSGGGAGYMTGKSDMLLMYDRAFNANEFDYMYNWYLSH